MMGWSLSSLKSLRRPSRQLRRAPKRNRSLILEDLEGRRLLSQAIQPLVTLPAMATSNIITGPDGDLWVGVSPTDGPSAIDRIGLDGSVTSFPLPGYGAKADIVSLTTGPDDNVWFDGNIATDSGGDTAVVIGSMTPAGVVTEFPPIPAQQPGPDSEANAIVSGPDGDLWFGYNLTYALIDAQDFIGQVTTTGAVTLFPTSSLSGNAPYFVSSLVVGADGNLWFTEQGIYNRLIFGRMSPSGVVTKFRIGDLYGGNAASGPNGSLILTAENSDEHNEVLRVSAKGAIEHLKIPAAISSAFATYLGSADGSLWFADGVSSPLKIGQITPAGKAVSHNLSTVLGAQKNGIGSMAIGQDSDLYLLDNIAGVDAGIAWYRNTATVYRLSPSSLPRLR
jgi:streptogramin lyase